MNWACQVKKEERSITGLHVTRGTRDVPTINSPRSSRLSKSHRKHSQALGQGPVPDIAPHGTLIMDLVDRVLEDLCAGLPMR